MELRPKWTLNPFVNTAVGNPWNSGEPDVKRINEDVYEGLADLLRQIRKTPNTGALVLGAAGTGKTHLIKRFVASADVDMIFVYVHPFKDPRTMFASLMREVVRDLEMRPRGHSRASEHTQLESIMAHVVAAGFEHYLRRHPDEGGKPYRKRIVNDPLKILSFRKSPKWSHLLDRTEALLKEQDLLTGPALSRVLRVLFQYLDKSKRDAVLTFLAGMVPDDTGCQALRVAFTESELSIESTEQRAKDVLKTIGVLLHYYRPMMLCFDQLENLHTPEMARSFGVLINDLVNEVDNVLPVAFVRPDFWQERLGPLMDRAPADRLRSREFVLRGLDLDQAMELVRARLDWAYEDVPQPRPHEFYPLRKNRLEECLQGRDTPRAVLLEANKLIGETPSAEDPMQIVRKCFDAEREMFLAERQRITLRKDVIVEALRIYFQSRQERSPYKVTKLNTDGTADLALVIKTPDKRSANRSVEIMVETAVHWKPIQGSLNYLRSRLEDRTADFVFFVRDAGHKIPPKKGDMQKTVLVREAFEIAGGKMKYMGLSDLADLYALVFTSDKIGAGDLAFIADSAGTVRKVDHDLLEKFVLDGFRSEFLTGIEQDFLGVVGSSKGASGKNPFSKDKRKQVIREVEVILAKPPYKFTLDIIMHQSKSVKGLGLTRDQLASVIGELGAHIWRIDAKPPLYCLREG